MELGNNWVICAVVVCLLVRARLMHEDRKPASASWLVLVRQDEASSPSDLSDPHELHGRRIRAVHGCLGRRPSTH